MTDVGGEPFWTLIAEATVEKIDDFFAMEQQLMSSEALRAQMAGPAARAPGTRDRMADRRAAAASRQPVGP